MAQPPTEEKKTRHRSPAYPTVGLREAVERAKKFYNTDHKAGAPPEIAVKHMGFASAHGQAMSVLAALKKFGLVAEANGRVVPTQRAIEIIELPLGDPRRMKALKDAAVAPVVYRELIEQHRDSGWPGDDVLEAELITYKNFNPNAVEGFVKDLRDTLDYAGLSDLRELELGEEESPEVTTSAESTKTKTAQERVVDADAAKFFRHFTPAGSQKSNQINQRTYDLDISIPRDLRAQLSIIGGDFKKEDLDKLKRQLARLLDNLEDAFAD